MIFGIMVPKADGRHYGWLRIARAEAHPSSDWSIQSAMLNPEPEAPIIAGLPPTPRPTVTVADGTIHMDWFGSGFPGWTVEVTSSLDPPVQWTRVSPGSGPPVSIAAGTAPLFMRLAK